MCQQEERICLHGRLSLVCRAGGREWGWGQAGSTGDIEENCLSLIEQFQPIDQFIECIPELAIILPFGEIKDVVFPRLLHDPLQPGTIPPAALL